MKQNLKLIVPAAFAAIVLSACGSTSETAKPTAKAAPTAQQQPAAQPAAAEGFKTVQVDSIDSKKEVSYKCGQGGKDAVSVMYGFKGKEPVVAQAKYKGQITPGLFRVIGTGDDVNAFWGEGVAWTAGRSNADNIDKVDGGMLTIRQQTTINGKTEMVDNIVTKYCVVEKAPAKGKAAKAKAKK